jgi:hypothetical protein
VNVVHKHTSTAAPNEAETKIVVVVPVENDERLIDVCIECRSNTSLDGVAVVDLSFFSAERLTASSMTTMRSLDSTFATGTPK